MDITASSTNNNNTTTDVPLIPTPALIDHHQLLREKYALPSSSYAENYHSAEDDLDEDFNVGIEHVKMDQSSWAAGLPEAQGLYDPDNEKDVSLARSGKEGRRKARRKRTS